MKALYRLLIRPLLFKLEPELAHRIAMGLLKSTCSLWDASKLFEFNQPMLQVKVLGMNFANPIGLAAGFDKDARYLRSLSKLGFGFIEIGTVTFHPQPGNPKPRVLRIPEALALWNRLGFNNDGAYRIEERLRRHVKKIPMGINLGKSKIVPLEKASEDYVKSFELLCDLGDYFVLNVSSPNTPGLRMLQEKENLALLIQEIQKKNILKKPLFVKISPDLSEEDLKAVVHCSLEFGVAGFIATNTTLSRNGIKRSLPEEGGISGAPLRVRSTEVIRSVYRIAGKKVCIIGVGGVFSPSDAYEKIKAGATLVQVYTGLIYEGPWFVKELNQGLVHLLKRDGFKSITEAVGVEAEGE